MNKARYAHPTEIEIFIDSNCCVLETHLPHCPFGDTPQGQVTNAVVATAWNNLLEVWAW